MLLTADRGVLDVPPGSTQVLCSIRSPASALSSFAVAGGQRAPPVAFETGCVASSRESGIGCLARDRGGPIVDHLSRAEAFQSRWFGPVVEAEVIPRIPETSSWQRARYRAHDSRATGNASRNMVGQQLKTWSRKGSRSRCVCDSAAHSRADRRVVRSRWVAQHPRGGSRFVGWLGLDPGSLAERYSTWADLPPPAGPGTLRGVVTSIIAPRRSRPSSSIDARSPFQDEAHLKAGTRLAAGSVCPIRSRRSRPRTDPVAR
jgi:hypothetical protein